MERLIHLNGDVIDIDDAAISPLDRGFLFADAVYEGMGVLDAQIVDFEHHHARLVRSLGEVDLPDGHTRDGWWRLLMDLVEANEIDEGFLYLQITRGADVSREYEYPDGLEQTVFAYTEHNDGPGADDPPVALTLATYPDLRWARRDIKTTNLLGQVLAKQHAMRQGCDEALLVTDDGLVTECGARSFFVVSGGTLITRPLTNEILPGVTRRSVVAVAEAIELDLEQRAITLDEARTADEAFTTGASAYVQPVLAIDGKVIGSGAAGPVTSAVRDVYLESVRRTFYRPA